MSLSERLELLINADPSQGISAMERFAKSTDKNITAAESSLKRFSSAALKLGGAGIGVGGLLTQLGDSERQAAGQLDAAIAATGQAVDGYRKRIEEAVTANEHFGHTASETDGALATLVGSYNDTGKALDQMQLVTDLAARKHISLGDAATVVAKAHGGAAKVFKEFNIQVGLNADGTKDYDGALSQLADKMKGQAAASVSGLTGWLKGLGAQAEDTAASFGEKFGPVILGVSAGVTALAPIVGAASKAMQAFSASTALTNAGVLGLVGPAGLAVTGLAALALTTGDAGEAQSRTAGAVQSLTDAMRVQGAEGLTQLNKKIADLLTTSADYPHVFEDAHASLVPFIDSIRTGGNDLRALQQAGVANNEGMQTFIDKMHDGQLAANPFNNELLRLATSGNLTSDQWVELIIVLNEGTKAFGTATDAANLLSFAEDGAKTATTDYVSALKALDDQLHSNLDPLFATSKALDDNAKAQYEAAAAGGENADKNQRAAETALAVYDATLKLEQSMKDGKTSLSEATAELDRFVAQGLLTQQQADALAASLASVAAQANLISGAVSSIPGIGQVAGHRALGGSVNANSSYLVGERGPELFTPGVSGGITPNDKLGKGAQGHTFYLLGNSEEQAAALSRRLRIDGMLSRP